MSTSSRRFPTRQGDLIPWAQSRAQTWAGGQSGPPAIGLSQSQVAEFAAAVAAVEAARAAQISARAAARSASLQKELVLKNMVRLLGSSITTIDGFARNTDDPDVWARADIDPPKPPSPRAAPPQPTGLTLEVMTSGAARVRFKVLAPGAVFEVQRNSTTLGGQESPWTTLGVVGEKFFDDESIPEGLRRVSYRVRAVLPNSKASPWSSPEPFNFGTAGSQAGPMAIADKAA